MNDVSAMNAVILEVVQRLRPLVKDNCKIGLILGSGLGAYAERIQNKTGVRVFVNP